MAVKTYRPEFSITVFKAITRSDNGQPGRNQGGQVWDITPHLGDGSEISVSKSVQQPKGSFVITIPDQPYKVAPSNGGNTSAGMDTLYGLLEPMDEIDIRLARNPAEYPNGPPLLMRGFIRSVRRVESMSSDGKPQRTTVIQGNDYGWIFEMTQLPPMVFLQYGLGLHMQSPWEQFFAIGAQQENRPVGEFFQLLLTHLINEQLINMKARFTEIPLEDIQPVAGTVVMTQQDQLIGPIWNIFLQWADLPWNELWVDDPETVEDDPPRLRFRTAPYRTWVKNGQFLDQGEDILIMGQDPAPYETVEIKIEDVVRLDASRSEQDVANIYWVQTPTMVNQQTTSYEMANAAAADNRGQDGLPGYMMLDGDEYPNSDSDLYCYRVMQVNSSLLSDQLKTGTDGQSEESMKKPDGVWGSWPDWAMLRRKALVECNADNVLLEEGSMTIKGNERIRAGKYVSLLRGKFGAEYYAQTVTHKFAPYRQYTTTINFVRGTGMIERLKLTGQSPYLQEGKQGVYS